MGDYERRPRRDRYVEFRPRGGRRPGGRGGRKRGREDPDESPAQALIREVMELGDAGQRTSTPVEKQLEDFLPRLHREIKNNPELVKETLLSCAVEVSTKTQQYATLIGFLNVEDAEFVKDLLKEANEEFNSALNTPDRHRARLLLRLFASLVGSNVLLPSSVVEMIDLLLNMALSTLENATDASGRSWQPWTDYIVGIVLLALPWGGSELVDSAPAEFVTVFEKIEKYIKERPIQNDPSLRPFLASIKEEDAAAMSDSGGASFLVDLWTAIQELRDKLSWKCQSIQRPSELIDHKLAAGHPIALPGIMAPSGPPGLTPDMSTSQQANAVNAMYPPRGGICLLDPVHTGGELPSTEKIILEEYIIDILHFFHEDRVACAQRLATSIPSPYPIWPLLAEVLFSHMLMLPSPPLKPVAYGALMVNLCQFTDLGPFPRGLSGCVRVLFSHMPALDPELSHRLAEWLCFHLSNLNFIWPWQKWKRVLEAPEYDPQRLFVLSTLRKLVNLSFLSHVKENISAKEFHQLLPQNHDVIPALPPAPAAESKECVDQRGHIGGSIQEQDHGKDAMQVGGDADEEMEEAGNGRGKSVECSNENEKYEGSGQETTMPVEASPAAKLTDELAQLMMGKEEENTLKEWLESTNFEDVLGGKEEALKGFVHALLLAGCRSITHTCRVMERYFHLFNDLAELCPRKFIIDKVVEAWGCSTQRICLILERIASFGLISGEDVVERAFESPGIAGEGSGPEVLRAWDVVRWALENEVANIKSAEDDVMRAELAVKDSEEAAQHAAHVAADGAARLEEGKGDKDTTEKISNANRVESKAREDVEGAVACVTEKKEAVERAKERHQNVLLKMYKCFANLLREKPLPKLNEESSEGPTRVFYSNLAYLASFSRAVSLGSQPLEAALLETFAEGKVAPEARAALFPNLRSGVVVHFEGDVFDVSLFVKKKVGEKEPVQMAEGKSDDFEGMDGIKEESKEEDVMEES